MSRGRRIKHERDGMLYHVMTRTVLQAFLFDEPVMREWIYRKIVSLGSIYFVDLHAVTVMSNHYHIVLAVRKPAFDSAELERRFTMTQAGKAYPEKWYPWRAKPLYDKLTDLSQFMKELNETVARYVNLKNQTRGHVWGDRFKSVLIEDGRGLLTCMAYVELNCVRAGLCAKPSDYRWCSAGRFHQGGARQAGVTIPNLLGFDALKKERQRQKGFTLFVDSLAEQGQNGESSFPLENTELGALIDQIDIAGIANLALRRTRWMINSLVLGSEGFCAEMIARFSLQTGRYNGPQPFVLSGDLCNSRQRAGPSLI